MFRMNRSWLAAGTAVALLGAAACSDVLDVNNPDEIPIDQLDDPKLLQVRLNGVVASFVDTYVGNVIQFASYPTDEVVTGLNWEDYARVNQRIISYLEGPTANIFEGLSRSLRLADGLAEDIRGWAADDPDEDFNEELARTLVYAGYSAVALAENMCQVVISPDPDNPSSDILDPLQTFAVAIPYLEEALSIAQAEGLTNIANLARTGLARAYLGRGEWGQAMTYAGAVASGFSWWMDFADLSGGRNPLQVSSFGGNFRLGIHPRFTGVHPSFDGTGFTYRNDNIIAPQTDPRIQHLPTDATGHNGLTPLYKIIQGLRYSQYTGQTIAPASAACPTCTGTNPNSMELLTDFDTDVLLADYLEARHHYFEALAMQSNGTDPAVLTFVNARRAVGNQPPVSLTGQALINELREQRARDLFMGGFRLPDLRRWTRFDPGNGPFAGGSYFPTGAHPNSPTWSDYEDWTCFPIPLSEYEGNDNLPKPTNPNTPPGI